MAKQDQPKRKPTHAIYHVRGEKPNDYWTKIGAAWIHEDGKGMNLSLDLLPVNGDGRLVIRTVEPKDQANGEAAQ